MNTQKQRIGPTRRWFNRIAGLALLSAVVYAGYIYFSGGYHMRPEMPDGAYSLSFKSGLRAIMLDIPDERLDRKYWGVAFEVPFWAESAWSFCVRPDEAQRLAIIKSFDLGPGSRLEAICTLDVDGEIIDRGAVFSTPRL